MTQETEKVRQPHPDRSQYLPWSIGFGITGLIIGAILGFLLPLIGGGLFAVEAGLVAGAGSAVQYNGNAIPGRDFNKTYDKASNAAGNWMFSDKQGMVYMSWALACTLGLFGLTIGVRLPYNRAKCVLDERLKRGFLSANENDLPPWTGQFSKRVQLMSA
jgi:hypothetical protein